MSTLPIKKPGVPLTTNDRSVWRELGDALFNPQALINDWNAGNKEKFDALMQNEAAAAALGPGVEKLAAGRKAANQARNQGELKAGNWGDALGRLTEGLVKDENGDTNWAGLAGIYGMKNAGDIAGGLLRANDWAAKADQAANMAGAFAEAQNSQARAALMGRAGEAADAMNLQNTARTGEMTDAAIADAGAFESGMQGIDMSGIEGSGNMERNLQYGKSRSEAQAEMQYAMINQEAQGLENSMARSFSELSQGKAGAVQQAWGQSIGRSMADLTALYQDTAAKEMHYAPTRSDEAALLAEAAKAAAGAPNLPGETAAAEATEPESTVEPEPPAVPAAVPVPAAAEGPDLYEHLVGFLGAEKKEGVLADELVRLGIDPQYHDAIQKATVAGPDNPEWRQKLFDVMKGNKKLVGNRTAALRRGER